MADDEVTGSRVAAGPDGLRIRREDRGDHPAVHDVVDKAFGDDRSVADLVALLRTDPATADGLSFVAVLGGEVVGHAMLSRGWLDTVQRLVPVLVLSPLSVSPEWQGQGIGTALVAFVLEEVHATAYPLVFLEGSPLYYSRFGFRRASREGFSAPSVRIPDPAFQVYLLPEHEEWMTGALVYPDAFWRMDAVGLREE